MTVASQVKSTLASLKNVRGMLRIYSEQSRNPECRDAFSEAVDAIGEVIGDLDGRVRLLEREEPQYRGF